MTCPRCRGLLLRDGEGLLVCSACTRVANPPPIGPVEKWPGGVQPAPTPPKPKFGNHAAKPPAPSHVWHEALTPSQWRRLMAAKEMVRRPAVGPKSKGKTHVAPTRGGLRI